MWVWVAWVWVAWVCWVLDKLTGDGQGKRSGNEERSCSISHEESTVATVHTR